MKCTWKSSSEHNSPALIAKKDNWTPMMNALNVYSMTNTICFWLCIIAKWLRITMTQRPRNKTLWFIELLNSNNPSRPVWIMREIVRWALDLQNYNSNIGRFNHSHMCSSVFDYFFPIILTNWGLKSDPSISVSQYF